MKSFVCEIRRFGELVFTGRFDVDAIGIGVQSAQAAKLAASEYLSALPSEVLRDKFGDRFNPGYTCFVVLRFKGFRILVRELAK